MPRADVSILQPGMIAGEDVRSFHGKNLAPRGTQLEASHILAFKTWGIQSVEIAADLASSSSDDDVEASCEEHVAMRFGNADLSHPLLRCLYALAVQRCHSSRTQTSAESEPLPTGRLP